MLTLKNVLRINALSSGLTGLLLTFFPGFFRDLFEVTYAAPFIGVGIFLIAFAITVAAVSVGQAPSHPAVSAIICADAAWVVASVVMVLMPISMSMPDTIIILAVASWVLMMAILQMRCLKEVVQQ